MYCREFLESPQSTALVVVSLLTNAQSTQPDFSQLTTAITVDGVAVTQNYNVARTTGGFYVSSTATETIAQGNRRIRLCVGSRSVTGWEVTRSEEHTSELQSLMRISYAVFCLKKNTSTHTPTRHLH